MWGCSALQRDIISTVGGGATIRSPINTMKVILYCDGISSELYRDTISIVEVVQCSGGWYPFTVLMVSLYSSDDIPSQHRMTFIVLMGDLMVAPPPTVLMISLCSAEHPHIANGISPHY